MRTHAYINKDAHTVIDTHKRATATTTTKRIGSTKKIVYAASKDGREKNGNEKEKMETFIDIDMCVHVHRTKFRMGLWATRKINMRLRFES